LGNTKSRLVKRGSGNCATGKRFFRRSENKKRNNRLDGKGNRLPKTRRSTKQGGRKKSRIVPCFQRLKPITPSTELHPPAGRGKTLVGAQTEEPGRFVPGGQRVFPSGQQKKKNGGGPSAQARKDKRKRKETFFRQGLFWATLTLKLGAAEELELSPKRKDHFEGGKKDAPCTVGCWGMARKERNSLKKDSPLDAKKDNT